MLFCTNCKLMVIYNPGYCPSCGILFRSLHELSEQDRLKAELTAKKWQEEMVGTYIQHMRFLPSKEDSKDSEDNIDQSYMNIQPGKKRLPRGLVGSIVSIIAIILLSILIYLISQ